MALDDFQFQKFDIPDLADVSWYVEDRYQLESVLAGKLAMEWVHNYCRNLVLFYLSQYNRHAKLVYQGLEAQDEAQDEMTSYALSEHAAFVNAESDRLTRVAARLQEKVEGESFLDWFRERLQLEFDDKIPSEEQLNWDLNVRWFDKRIENLPQSIRRLRKLSYVEYLKTPHWKRVRTSLVMIRRAVCQHETCYSFGESFYPDWEAELDVHHLSYTRLGSERYVDLALLCKQHHKLWHENMRKTGNPGFKLGGYYSS